jgi:hypothetical protein
LCKGLLQMNEKERDLATLPLIINEWMYEWMNEWVNEWMFRVVRVDFKWIKKQKLAMNEKTEMSPLHFMLEAN